mgnify:CR=1 FL=1
MPAHQVRVHSARADYLLEEGFDRVAALGEPLTTWRVDVRATDRDLHHDDLRIRTTRKGHHGPVRGRGREAHSRICGRRSENPHRQRSSFTRGCGRVHVALEVPQLDPLARACVFPRRSPRHGRSPDDRPVPVGGRRTTRRQLHGPPSVPSSCGLPPSAAVRRQRRRVRCVGRCPPRRFLRSAPRRPAARHRPRGR